MDLAACAKRVFIILEHTQRDGTPRLLARCALPVTARGVVKLVVTESRPVRAGRARASRCATWRRASTCCDQARAATACPVTE